MKSLEHFSVSQTFVHLKGIGPKADLKIKEAGIQHWDMALEYPDMLPLSALKRAAVVEELKRYREQLLKDQWQDLIRELPQKEHWRILKDNFSRASYFDIETDGLSMYEGEPTVICCYHKGEMYTYLNGDNLDDFVDLLGDVHLMVSFNGASFDVPYVQNYFNMPTFPCAHVDLRWICHHKGLKGGLKSIERELGLQREDDVVGVDGREAIMLWQRWKWYGQEAALRKLVHYCRADTAGLLDLANELMFM